MNAPDSMRQLDYPAAHSMDSYWFALDDAGEVAFMSTGETGAIPSTCWRVHGWREICTRLDKDEFGISILPVNREFFPEGTTTSDLDRLISELPDRAREIICRLATDRETSRDEKDEIMDRLYFDPEFSEAERFKIFEPECVIWLASPEDIKMVSYDILLNTPPIRLDPERPIYHVSGGLLDVIGLHLQQRIQAVRTLRFIDDGRAFCDDWALAEIYGIYLYDAKCAGDNPDPYEIIGLPTQARMGLPDSCMKVPARLPGVRFAQQGSIMVDDVVECYNWGTLMLRIGL